MKKLFAMALVFALCFSLTACCCCVGTDGEGKNVSIEGMLGDLDMDGLFGGADQQKEQSNDADAQYPGTATIAPDNSDMGVYMPDLVNEEISYAEMQLQNYDVAVAIEYAFSDYYEKGIVISQSITAGTELYGGEWITLTVSKGSDVCPYDYSQKLVVTASSGSSYATASLYEWQDGDWQLVVSYNATVGRNGIGQAYEGSKRTPQGLHKIGVVLSSYSVSTNMDTYRVTSTTCVVDDPDSYYYNRIMDRSQVPSGTSYDQIGRGLTNGTTYAFIYIEHNGTGFSSEGVVSGAGSVMGIRGQYNTLAPTYGDVDISVNDMKDLLQRLDSSKNPMIEIKTY